MSTDRSVIDVNSANAAEDFSHCFKSCVFSHMDDTYKSLVILCIGTDRSTGDSLGPIVGYKLSGIDRGRIEVYGTLDEPVHAKNLSAKLDEIYRLYRRPFIVAIDACLGLRQNVGHINISSGPMHPGAGVNKNLLPVGDMSITGVINVGGCMEYSVLQNTRLNLVMMMADTIADGIMSSICDINARITDVCI